jgi:ankyrin repeat protein
MSILVEINGQNEHGNTFLHLTVNKSDVYNVGKLLSMGADPDIQNNNGFTPLYIAIMNIEPNIKILQLLREYHAVPNICDPKRQWTCLHLACYKKDLLCIKFLLYNYVFDLQLDVG